MRRTRTWRAASRARSTASRSSARARRRQRLQRSRDSRGGARLRRLRQRLRPRIRGIRLLALRDQIRPHLHGRSSTRSTPRPTTAATRSTSSFGGGGPDAELKDALDYAWERGSIPVASGANEPTPSAGNNYPAQYMQPEGSGPNIDAGRGLVVTSAKYSGARSAFAQSTSGISLRRPRLRQRCGKRRPTGNPLHLAAGGPRAQPRHRVREPQPSSAGANEPVRGTTASPIWRGPSMATPQVAGLVALIRAERPMMPAAKVVRLMKVTGEQLRRLRRRDRLGRDQRRRRAGERGSTGTWTRRARGCAASAEPGEPPRRRGKAAPGRSSG